MIKLSKATVSTISENVFKSVGEKASEAFFRKVVVEWHSWGRKNSNRMSRVRLPVQDKVLLGMILIDFGSC